MTTPAPIRWKPKPSERTGLDNDPASRRSLSLAAANPARNGLARKDPVVHARPDDNARFLPEQTGRLRAETDLLSSTDCSTRTRSPRCRRNWHACAGAAVGETGNAYRRAGIGRAALDFRDSPAEPAFRAAGARRAAGGYRALYSWRRGLYPSVAAELQAGLRRQGILLAFRFRDLACRGRHAAHAGAVDVGAAVGEFRAQRAADADSRFAPNLSSPASARRRRTITRQSLRKQEYGVPDRESLAKLADQAGGIGCPPVRPARSSCSTATPCTARTATSRPIPRSNAFFVYNAVSNALVAPFGAPAPRPEFIAARTGVMPEVALRGPVGSKP